MFCRFECDQIKIQVLKNSQSNPTIHGSQESQNMFWLYTWFLILSDSLVLRSTDWQLSSFLKCPALSGTTPCLSTPLHFICTAFTINHKSLLGAKGSGFSVCYGTVWAKTQYKIAYASSQIWKILQILIYL